jgi:subtilisin family serine protease
VKLQKKGREKTGCCCRSKPKGPALWRRAAASLLALSVLGSAAAASGMNDAGHRKAEVGALSYRLPAAGAGPAAAEAGLLAPASASASEPSASAAASSNGGAANTAYLGVIGIPEAWKKLKSDVKGTIAVIDTGVDLKHPALTPYLTSGVNLVQSGKPPQDDNGHGTAVAGILAAAAQAAPEGAGKPSWKAKIMPIKALDRNGTGNEARLTQAIRYAVQHGADMIVLSLGLRRDAPELRAAVEQAEAQGVLLVAAVGNDGGELGEKAAVQYPAAYPTVLAVGGTDGKQGDPRSNAGPEMDVAAPWQVRTAALGGGYTAMEGTSMGAPQAAAVAALVRAAHPSWPPALIREAIRQSAKDIGPPGWDARTGYGLLQAQAAVEAREPGDWREPNASRATAAAFPVGTELAADWSGSRDSDWYRIDVPYDGVLSVTLDADPAGRKTVSARKPQLTLEAAGGAKAGGTAGEPPLSGKWTVRKGTYILKADGAADRGGNPVGYRLVSQFRIRADAAEPNDSPSAAKTIPARTQIWTGTFDHAGDEDWFAFTLPSHGLLSISIAADTSRIDPALLLQPAEGKPTDVDENGDGAGEQLVVPDAAPGLYYLQVRNAVSARPEPVIGTYRVRMEYTASDQDLNEPNDNPLTATPIAPGTSRKGRIDSASDADWFRFGIDADRFVRLRLAGIPGDAAVRMELTDKKLKTVGRWDSKSGQTALEAGLKLESGTYYVSIASDRPFRSGSYELSLQSDPLLAGYRDISRHWAAGSIVSVTEAGLMHGYAQAEFRPDQSLTRAEAVSTLVQAFRPKASPAGAALRFGDIPRGNWAYEAVARADAAGWLSHFGGARFEPYRPITRAEAADLLAKAAGLGRPKPYASTFADVPVRHWASPSLEALVRRGWLSGYPGGDFRPDRTITRAEWAALLARLL